MKDKLAEEILKSCPFCGKQPMMDIYKRGYNYGWEIKCSCGISRKQLTLHYSLDWLKSKMIEKWNTRIESED